MGISVGQLPEDDRWADPLVLHPQLADDHAVPVWHGRDDLAADPLQGHHQVQRARHRGGGCRGDRLEARARGRVSKAQALEAAGGLRRLWCADPRHVGGDPALRPAGPSVAGAPRWLAAVDDAPVHLHGHVRGLRLVPPVQAVGGRRLEADDPAHRVPVPGDAVRRLLRPEPADLGAEVLRRSALHHDVRAPRPVVRHLRASRVPRRVHRL
mmetsp:Transcript_59725/g.158821  ORF Transcript_59725/g.158821 Transcript_59725/m.158821 type:complete len:211 (+) Transcript_59725:667-1299(+)